MSRAAPAFGTLSELAENHKNRGKQHRNNQKVICVLRRSTDRSIRNCRHVTPSGQSNTHSILPQHSRAQHSTAQHTYTCQVPQHSLQLHHISSYTYDRLYRAKETATSLTQIGVKQKINQFAGGMDKKFHFNFAFYLCICFSLSHLKPHNVSPHILQCTNTCTHTCLTIFNSYANHCGICIETQLESFISR